MKASHLKFIGLGLTFIILLAPSIMDVGAAPVTMSAPATSESSTSGLLPAAPPTQPLTPLRPVVGHSVWNGVSPEVRSLPPVTLERKEPIREIPLLPLPKRGSVGRSRNAGGPTAPLLQERPGAPNMPAPIMNFEGLDNMSNVLPPDTNGDVGREYYIQIVNATYVGIYDKETGTLATPPFLLSSLWPPSDPCGASDDGDPIALYDPLANRWLLSQFGNAFVGPPYYQCIAISQTSDPLGSWYVYTFLVHNAKFNDYPKFGVWPDAYYMAANQFEGSEWAGQGVWAFDRASMLSGDPGTFVYFDLYDVNYYFGGMLPADLDGFNPPPSGAPGYFVEWDDAAWIPPEDALRIWEFHVDWVNPTNSTFGVNGQPNAVIPTADVDPDMCGFSRNCIPQPCGMALDAISDRLMYRLQYRNFGGYETLVSNHTVDVGGSRAASLSLPPSTPIPALPPGGSNHAGGHRLITSTPTPTPGTPTPTSIPSVTPTPPPGGSDHAGIHWFELRKSNGVWSLYQEGVYAPDEDHRWMGSIAMDHMGNIALGYSVSSNNTYPSIRYTGRLVSDPLGTLPQGEAELIAGSGCQEHLSGRWGDYSMMAIDPVDDCTFWYTQEYYAVTGNAPWQTRIGSFRFPDCTLGPQGTLAGQVYDADTSAGIVGATVEASSSSTQTQSTTTGTGGLYSMLLLSDTYTVTASAYGYRPNTISPVDVLSGTTTTLDIPLTPAASYVVSGTITDAATGWPLYASVDIDGYPGGTIWNDPVTGYYSVTLVEGVAYTFDVEAWVDGYLPAGRAVGPLVGNETQDFGLDADQMTCVAPGYSPTYAYFEDFEADDGGYTHTGTYDEWEWGTPVGWPNGCHSGSHCWGTDLDDNYEDYSDQELYSPVIDLSAIPSGTLLTAHWWQAWAIESAWYDQAYAEVSINGGPWIEMWSHTSETTRVNWTEMTYDISAAAGGNVQFRWRLISDYSVNYEGLYVDDVSIVSGCVPQTGGLVVGHVYDANTNTPLIGAEVANEDGFLTTTEATPGDPAVDDGFYTLFSPAGPRTFTATMTNYGAGIDVIIVVQDDTVEYDFHLPAGMLTYTPAGLEVTLDMNMSTTLPLTLTNEGGKMAEFELLELDKGASPLGPFEEPSHGIEPPKQHYLTTKGLDTLKSPPAPPYAAGDIIQTWPTNLAYVWGLGYNADATDLWLGDIAAGNGTDLDYRFLTDGTNTGDTIDISWATYWAADMAYNLNTGMLWQLDVGEPGCIHELDPVNMTHTGNLICPSWSVSQRGLAYDPSTDTYFVGGWNDQMIYRFAPDGTILAQVNVGLNIAGLAYNPDTEHLFVMVNASPNPVYVLDVADNYNILGQFSITGFSDYGGAGLEMDCEGNLWAVDQNTQIVYQFESGETTSMCKRDVFWLSEEPISGTVAPMTSQPIDVTFDTGEADQPGIYYAQLKIKHDTPYDVAHVPVAMTVNAPATWGKVKGTVYGLGHCDANPTPLESAEVLIESGTTVTLTTDTSGTYTYWLEQGTYTVTVSEADHLSDTIVVNVTAGMTTTQDFALRWLRPCISVTPLSMEAVVLRGTSETRTITLTNDGAAASLFKFYEMTRTVIQRETAIGARGSPSPSGPTGVGPDIQAQPATVLPTIDGSIAPGEWDDALIMDIHDPGAATQPVYMYIKNDGQYLYVAFEDLNDTTITSGNYDQNGIYFDDEGGTSPVLYDNAWTNTTCSTYPAGEGNFWFGDFGTHTTSWREWIAGPDTCPVLEDPPNVEAASGSTDGHRSYEMRIDLNNSSLQASPDAGDIFGYRVYVYDSDTDTFTARWPLTAFYDDPSTYGNLQLAQLLADLPWLSEDPITGTVGADSAFPVSITFTAFPTMSAGIYSATLAVNTNDPVNGRINVPVNMTVIAAPICGFISSSPDDLGETTYFTNTTDTGLAPTTYCWDFGDGSPISTLEHPTHTYALPALYTVTLTATNPYGQDVHTGIVSIEGVVGGFVSNSPVDLGDPMVFTNTTMANPPIVRYFWTFGDSHSSEDENPVHTYTAAGVYTVTLFAANVLYAPDNVYDIYQDTVEVLTGQPRTIYLPLTVRNYSP